MNVELIIESGDQELGKVQLMRLQKSIMRRAREYIRHREGIGFNTQVSSSLVPPVPA
jgi:hypothetical protein